MFECALTLYNMILRNLYLESQAEFPLHPFYDSFHINYERDHRIGEVGTQP